MIGCELLRRNPLEESSSEESPGRPVWLASLRIGRVAQPNDPASPVRFILFKGGVPVPMNGCAMDRSRPSERSGYRDPLRKTENHNRQAVR